jgi:hypothetical protein
MKIKPDQTLDTKDSYKSDWIGEPGPDDKEETLSGNEHKIIGVHMWNWGRLFAIALVLDE